MLASGDLKHTSLHASANWWFSNTRMMNTYDGRAAALWAEYLYLCMIWKKEKWSVESMLLRFRLCYIAQCFFPLENFETRTLLTHAHNIRHHVLSRLLVTIYFNRSIIHFHYSPSAQLYSLSTPRSYRTNPTTAAGTIASDPKDKFRRCAVQPGTICCEQLVQEGTYGRVYSGSLQLQQQAATELSEVLIKTVVGKNMASLLSNGFESTIIQV